MSFEIDREVLDAALGLGPLIKEHSAEGESNGRVPTAVIQAMKDAGLARMMTPKSVGGLEVDPVTSARVFGETLLSLGSNRPFSSVRPARRRNKTALRKNHKAVGRGGTFTASSTSLSCPSATRRGVPADLTHSCSPRPRPSSIGRRLHGAPGRSTWIGYVAQRLGEVR